HHRSPGNVNTFLELSKRGLEISLTFLELRFLYSAFHWKENFTGILQCKNLQYLHICIPFWQQLEHLKDFLIFSPNLLYLKSVSLQIKEQESKEEKQVILNSVKDIPEFVTSQYFFNIKSNTS